MSLQSGVVHVTKRRKLLVSAPEAGAWVHLCNLTVETDCPAYLGDENVVPGSGLILASGAGTGLPYSIFIGPDAELYAIANEDKDCKVGFIKTP
jgi:hypothetical protein